MISAALRNAIRSDLDTWEGFYSSMYLDSVGLVTIGYGTMLPDANTAAAISFIHKKGTVATVAEIRAAYNVIHSGSAAQKAALPKQKFGARHYEKVTDLRITQATASQLRDTHIDADYQQLRSIYPKFDDFPDAARIALFDMIYNLGAGHGKTRHHRATGLRAYVGMNAAIARGEWAKAAQLCHRHGIPPARNAATAALFKSCAVVNVGLP
jgi:GH24 family phage-related lysozyme (muramidase)